MELTSERVEAIIARLKRIADVIVIDAPRLPAASDAVLLTAVADATLVVARVGRTRPETLKTALDTITITDTRVLGVVLHS